ncbi:MAG: hypothetical protein IJG33_16095 [Selenomonadaceae bacterium]|nr:hypothetical protein [Selenomonadaceae bacterium]
MNFDDVEHLLEGLLAGLKARKEIEPLRKRLAELEAENKRLAPLAEERDDFKQRLDEAAEDFAKREEELRGEFGRELDKANENLSELDKERQIADGTANYYRKNYSELDAAYKIYLALDEATRYDLSGIFGAGETATGFFSGAVQEAHLAPFWDYVSRRTDNDNLSHLFDFCFDVVNRGFREAPYVRLQVDSGDFFDNDTMRRTSQSMQRGKVVRVVLQGYRYSGGNVVKKTIVELG